MQPQSTPQQQRLVWWILWVAFQIGLVVIYVFLGKARSSPHGNELAFWQLGILPALVSGAIRWSLLPTFKAAEKALPFFIIGIALAEMSCFLGLFIFPSHKTQLFAASFIGIFQFIPVYFGRYFQSTSGQ